MADSGDTPSTDIEPKIPTRSGLFPAAVATLAVVAGIAAAVAVLLRPDSVTEPPPPEEPQPGTAAETEALLAEFVSEWQIDVDAALALVDESTAPRIDRPGVTRTHARAVMIFHQVLGSAPERVASCEETLEGKVECVTEYEFEGSTVPLLLSARSAGGLLTEVVRRGTGSQFNQLLAPLLAAARDHDATELDAKCAPSRSDVDPPPDPVGCAELLLMFSRFDD